MSKQTIAAITLTLSSKCCNSSHMLLVSQRLCSSGAELHTRTRHETSCYSHQSERFNLFKQWDWSAVDTSVYRRVHTLVDIRSHAYTCPHTLKLACAVRLITLIRIHVLVAGMSVSVHVCNVIRFITRYTLRVRHPSTSIPTIVHGSVYEIINSTRGLHCGYRPPWKQSRRTPVPWQCHVQYAHTKPLFLHQRR
jgi:hypothetical protein